MSWHAVCRHCGERIGVYEPAAVAEPEGVRITSLAREPELRGGATRMFHAQCAAERPDDGS